MKYMTAGFHLNVLIHFVLPCLKNLTAFPEVVGEQRVLCVPVSSEQ